jgi:hypothetical protein
VVRELSARKRPKIGAQPANKLVAGLGVGVGAVLGTSNATNPRMYLSRAYTVPTTAWSEKPAGRRTE